MKTTTASCLVLGLVAATIILPAAANDTPMEQPIANHRDSRYRLHDNSRQQKTEKPQSATSSDTLGYKHQDAEVTRLGFALAFLLVVMPPIVFICIYAPGECLIAIGISKVLIGAILHYVHSQDPYTDKYPPHTNPSIYILVGMVWIFVGLCKNRCREMARDLEDEDAGDRRKKYSERRKMWEQEESRERRRRERQERRKAKAKKGPKGSYEMVPLKPKKGRNKGRESDNEEEDSYHSSFSNGSYHSSFSNGSYNSSFSEAGSHSSFSGPV